MIDLAGLAALATAHADDLARPVAPLRLGGRTIDTDVEPVLMGVVNLSGGSGYRESVATSAASAVRRGRVLAAQGAHLVDVGAESSDLTTERVDADAQTRALVPVVAQLAEADVVVSVESYETSVLAACLEAGARMVNLSGSVDDDAVFDLAARHDAAVVLCHVHGRHVRDLDGGEVPDDPFPAMLEQFGRRLDRARELGVRELVVDPGIGFEYPHARNLDRYRHQSRALLGSFRLRALGVPVCHALPYAFDLFEDEVRVAEPFFAVLASLGRTGVLRTHEVARVRAVLAAMGVLEVQGDAAP